MVRFMISHSVLNIHTERRFDDAELLGGLKLKLNVVVGTPPEFMTLQVQDKQGNVVQTLDGDAKPLSAFALGDFAYLHVVDSDPNRTAEQFNDLSSVDKYEISEEAYDKRRDTFRKFKQKYLSKEEDPEEEKRRQEERERDEAVEAAAAERIELGARCEFDGKGAAVKQRGTVRYVGEVHFREGVWVGVELDEPAGKHDGKARGRRYFQCADGHGVLTRPTRVEVGDFPEKDPFDELDDSSDDEEDPSLEL